MSHVLWYFSRVPYFDFVMLVISMMSICMDRFNGKAHKLNFKVLTLFGDNKKKD